MSFDHDDTNDLINRIVDGDEEGWDEFVERYSEKIYWFPLHKYYRNFKTFNVSLQAIYDEKPDVIKKGEFYSEVRNRLSKGILRNFNPEHSSGAKFETWFNEVLTNILYDLYRKNKRKIEIEKKFEIISFDALKEVKEGEKKVSLGETIPAPDSSIEEKIESENIKEKLIQLIENLPDEKRIIIKLLFFGDFKLEYEPEEIRLIAELTKEPIESVIKNIEIAVRKHIEKRAKGVGKDTLSIKDISEILKIPQNTIGVKINRIKKFLIKKLKCYE